jgi:hypothetical protein
MTSSSQEKKVRKNGGDWQVMDVTSNRELSWLGVLAQYPSRYLGARF